MTGKQSAGKNKSRGEERTLEKCVTGGEKAWKRSLEKIIAEIEEMKRHEERRW